MRILLIDVDSKIPNLALMKLSTYYKNLNYSIDFIKLGLSGYPNKKKQVIVDAKEYDRVHCSNVFINNRDKFIIEGCDDINIGGIGSINPHLKLPLEIEYLDCDYSLYPDNDKSYGFITRGCIRNCWFCFVPKTEGKLYKYMDVDKIIKHKKVSFMDNNILAYDKHLEILQYLIDNKIRCEFNQGLDIRLLNDDNALLLSKLNYMGEYVFAFDDLSYKPIIEKKIKLFKKYIEKDWKVKFFVYIHPDMELKTLIDRVEWCRENKCLPYVMRDKECWNSENYEFYVDYAAYCNQPSFFKKMSFELFLEKRHKNRDRIDRVLNIHNNISN